MTALRRTALIVWSAMLEAACAPIAGLEDGELATSGGSSGQASGGAADGGLGGAAGKPTSGGSAGTGGGVGGSGGSAGSVGSAYAAAVMSDGPIGYWRFGEDTTPVAKDSSGNGNDGTYKAITVGVPGAIANDPDTAIRFENFPALVDFGDKFGFAGNAKFTFELWYWPEPDTPGIFGKATYDTTNGYQGFMLVENFNDILGFDRAASAYCTKPPRKAWAHVVVTYDGVTLRVYVNGNEQTSVVDEAPLETTSAQFSLGNPAEWTQFVGAMDELAIYDQPLAPPRILAHYKIGTGT